MIRLELLKLFKKQINSFVTVDYQTPDGIETAKGKLVSVSDEGDILITHLLDNRISWGFNISKVQGYKFTPIRGDNDDT